MKRPLLIFPFCLSLIFVLFILWGQYRLKNLNQKNQSTSLKPTKAPLSLTITPTQEKEPVTIIAVGDIMLGRSINSKMHQLNDFSYPFTKTDVFLKTADLTFGNLEAPLVKNCPLTNSGMIFCADLRAVQGLTQSGFDILNLINNHTLNYGQDGLKQTQKILEENQIKSLSGNLNYQIMEIKKTKIAFLGFNLLDKFDADTLIGQVRTLKNQSDLIVVSLHWGNEYQKQPQTWQKNLAHLLIEAGADLVLGHHPHVIQTTEEYQDKLIVYSLGNFVFDQPWSEETKKGLVGIFTFQDKKLVKKEFREVYLKNLGQPMF